VAQPPSGRGGCGLPPAERKFPPRASEAGDSPKAALLAPDGNLGGDAWGSSLASGLRSERYNPPSTGPSRTGRQTTVQRRTSKI